MTMEIIVEISIKETVHHFGRNAKPSVHNVNHDQQGVLTAWILLILSRHPFLSDITLIKSSRWYPVSTKLMNVSFGLVNTGVSMHRSSWKIVAREFI